MMINRTNDCILRLAQDKITFLFYILLGFSYNLGAQSNDYLSKSSEVFTVVDTMPVFKGCDELNDLSEKEKCTQNAIYQHIAKTTNYPKEAQDKGISGTVYGSFIINNEGNIDSVKILKGIEGGELLEREAIRVFQALPQFIPAIKNNRTVNVKYFIPIKFYMRKLQTTNKNENK